MFSVDNSLPSSALQLLSVIAKAGKCILWYGLRTLEMISAFFW